MVAQGSHLSRRDVDLHGAEPEGYWNLWKRTVVRRTCIPHGRGFARPPSPESVANVQPGAMKPATKRKIPDPEFDSYVPNLVLFRIDVASSAACTWCCVTVPKMRRRMLFSIGETVRLRKLLVRGFVGLWGRGLGFLKLVHSREKARAAAGGMPRHHLRPRGR